MLDTSLPPWPAYTPEEIEAVAAVLRSNRVNYWTGDQCRQFEREFADWCGTSHAIALANGTVALDLALNGLGIGAGDEVIVTPRTFIASASCVVNAGAIPVFADVDPESGNLSAETIAEKVTPATRAVIVVHMAGWPADMDPIMALAETHGFAVIEDCAQAHGARYKGRSVGSIGHVGAWSFCQDKIMTTGGEGGMVTTSDPALWSRMWSFKDHGKAWEAVYERRHPAGFRWVHEGFGTNWRMTEIQGAIGRIQLARMGAWTAARRANAASLAAAFAPHTGTTGCLRLPWLDAGEGIHAFYKFYAYVRPERLREGWSRDRIVEAITARGIPCYQGGCSEVYLERAFEGTGWRPEARLPVAQVLGETSIMLLVHPGITPAQLRAMGEAVDAVLAQASLAPADAAAIARAVPKDFWP